MNKEEAIKQCNWLISDCKNGVEIVNATDILAIETVLNELEKQEILNGMQQNKINWCEKNTLSKDKIREKIEDLKQAETLPLEKGEIDLYYFAEDILEELLKESD